MALTVAQLVARVTADTSGFYKSMAIMNSSLIRTGGLASRALAGIGLATTGVGILSLRAAGNYQQSMNVLQAVSGATAAQMGKLGDEAISLGKDIKLPNVSAKDAADVMVELSKAGLTVKDTLNATRGTLQLGVAANIGFADAAKITAKSLKMFNLEGNQSMRVSNLLAAGANASTAEITDLAYGMQNAGAQFEGAGYSIEDLTVSLSALVDRGLSGEQAGTALKVMLQRLQNPTKDAAGLLKNLGVSVADAKGNMLPIPKIIDQFTKGFRDLNPLQRQQALNTIFGARANQAMNKLLGVGVDGWDKYSKKIVGTNAAVKMAEARTKGFNGAIGALGSAAETLAIQLGTALLPSAEKVVRALAAWIASIDPQQIIDFFSAIKNNVQAVFEFVRGSTALRAILAGLAAGFAAMFIVKNVASSFMALRAAVVALNASLYTNPIVLIVGALVALGAALYYAYTRSETFRNIVNTAFAFLRDTVVPMVLDFANQVIANFKKIWETVKPILSLLTSTIRNYWNQIASFTKANWDQIRAILLAAWTAIKAIFTTFIQNVLSVFKIFGAVLRGDWGEVWNQIKAMMSRSLSLLITLLKASVSTFMAAATLVGRAIWQGIKNALSDLRSKIYTVLQAIGHALASVATEAVGWALSIGKAIVSGVLQGLVSLPMKIGSAIAKGVRSAIDWARNNVGSTAAEHARDTIGKDIPAGITAGMLLGFVDLPDKLSAKVKDMIDKAQKTVETQKSKLVTAFQVMANDILTAFDAITEKTKTRSEKLLDQLISQKDLADFRERLAAAKKELQDAKTALLIQGGTFQLPDITQNEGESTADYLKRKQEAEDTYRTEWLQKNAEAQQRVQTAEAAWNDLMYEQKKAALEKRAAQERLDYGAARALQRRHLDETLTNLIEMLKKHPEKWRYFQARVLKVIEEYNGPFNRAGQALGKSFADGLAASIKDAETAAKLLAGTVSSYLPRSPAEKGPLKVLPDFTDYMLRGFDASVVNNALATGLTRPAYTGATAPAVSPSLLGGGPAVINQYIIEGSLIREQDLDDRILLATSRQQQRGRTL